MEPDFGIMLPAFGTIVVTTVATITQNPTLERRNGTSEGEPRLNSEGMHPLFPDGNPLIDLASKLAAELQRPPLASLSGEGSGEGRGSKGNPF
jgi:hypothetical protein